MNKSITLMMVVACLAVGMNANAGKWYFYNNSPRPSTIESFINKSKYDVTVTAYQTFNKGNSYTLKPKTVSQLIESSDYRGSRDEGKAKEKYQVSTETTWRNIYGYIDPDDNLPFAMYTTPTGSVERQIAGSEKTSVDEIRVFVIKVDDKTKSGMSIQAMTIDEAKADPEFGKDFTAAFENREK